MRTRRTLPRYFHLSLGLAIVAGVAVALCFALVSGIRHILWLQVMPSGHSNLALWLETLAVAGVTLLFWYRMVRAILRHRRQELLMQTTLATRLRPFEQRLPNDLRHIAKWYLLDEVRPVAFTWGALQPSVALSTGLCETLDETAQQAVMHHEAAHVRARDPLQQAVLAVLSDAFGPVGIKALYRHYLVTREISADQFATAACHGDDVPLLNALVAVAKAEPTSVTVASYVGLAGVMEARVAFLSTGVLPTLWDRETKSRLFASAAAISITVLQGLLVWCH